jgi:hypothetical protein
MLTPGTIFDFKQFCRRNTNECMDIYDLANEFMYMNRLYGEDIYNELIKVEI